MAINIDPLYGTESTWLNVKGYGKLATFTQQYDKKYFNHTIGAGLANGSLDVINKSVCPIAVDSGSTLGNGHYVTLNQDGTLYDYVVEPSAQTSLMYASSFRGTSANTYYNQYVETRDDTQNSSWNSGKTSNDYVTNFPAVATSMTQPIVEFPYKNYVLIIIVFASADTTAPYYESNTVRCDLATYLSKYATSHPYVNCVEVSPVRWTSEYQYPDFTPSNISVNSDSSDINRTTNQSYFNFSAIGIGNVNKMVDRDGNEHLFYTSNNHNWYESRVYFWDGDEYRYREFNGRQSIFGYGESWVDDLVENYTRAVYIPDVNGMIQIKQRETSRPDRIYTYYHVTDVKAFEEFCLRQTAYFGMYFSTSLLDMNSLTPDTLTTKETTYLGIIDETGVTHGEYAKGKDIKKYPQSEWDSLKNQSPYDYKQKPDPERTSDPYKPAKFYNDGFSFGTFYILNNTQLTGLRKWCSDIANPPGPFVISDPAENQYSYEDFAYTLQRNFNGGYPADKIASVMEFPYMPKVNYPSPHETNIQLGNALTKAFPNWFGHEVTGTTGLRILGDSIHVFKTDNFTVSRDEYGYGDFRDFAPYTSMSVTIPFHGTVDINPDIVYDKPMSVMVVTDFITGASTGYVLVNGYPIASIDAQVGISIPLTLSSAANISNTIIQSAQQINAAKNAKLKSAIGIVAGLATTATGTLTGVATGLAGGAAGIIAGGVIGGAAGASKAIASGADYQMADKSYDIAQHSMESAQSSSVQVSSQSPAVSSYYDPTCKLNITYSFKLSGSNLATYAKTVGYACNQQGLVQDFTGLSVFDGIRMDGLQAPEEIKHMIYDQLRQGVIV